MSDTKDKVLYELLKKRGDYVSGEAIAEKFGLSRVAVSKAVKALEQEGYVFDAVRNRGYAIITSEDILNADIVRDELLDKTVDVEIFSEINSTCTYAKERVYAKDKNFIVIANGQSSGRGRVDRSFSAPIGEGLYMTVAIKSPMVDNAGIVTMFAAVAVSRVVDKIFGVKTDIKWVNDIFLDGKKLCGILTEGVLNFEDNTFDWVVVGAGINIYNPQFSEEVKKVATSLMADKSVISRNRVAAAIYNEFVSILKQDDKLAIIDEYRRKSLVLGKKVKAIAGDRIAEGVALNILDNGNLIIETESGEKITFIAGDVSLRF